MLSLSNKKWIVARPAEDRAARLADELGVSPVVAGLLINRNLETADQCRLFIEADLGKLHDPFLMSGMKAAVDRIVSAIERGESITVFADYDVDGVTSAALLIHFFRDLGVPIAYYLPERMREGYGVSETALSKIRADGGSLVITADCGITAVGEARAARAMGLDLIVTDHHQVGGEGVPEAVAVLNPHQPGCSYPFRFLCGVGIVFKLVTAVRSALYRAGWEKERLPNLRQYLDLFALGTIADVAPLTGENHLLVGHGLEEMAVTRKPGLVALKAVTELDGALDARAVGFVLGPRLNAAGRLGKADTGLHLLTATDLDEAMELAKTLNDVNRERQDIQKWIQEEAEYRVAREIDLQRDRVIVLASENFHRGVVGIVAARVMEKYFRPTILIALENGVGHGSGRSIPKFNLHKALAECADCLTQFGGHAFAAGFSIEENNIDSFRKALNDVGHRFLAPEDLIAELAVDAALDLADISLERCREIQSLKPFGAGNPTPVFLTEGVSVRGVRFVGREEKHARFRAVRGGRSIDGIGFNLAEVFRRAAVEEQTMDLVYEIQINAWNGREKPQLNLLDLRPAGAG
ncbi:MAG: single-stranded-DNA-specific exonuclease RecJ [Nitrospinales bacterium]